MSHEVGNVGITPSAEYETPMMAFDKSKPSTYERDEKSEIAALWGSAENGAYGLGMRLNFALEALERMSKLVPGWDE